MNMKIMFLGTSSNAGKTTVSAAFCRYLSRKRYDVAPFKGSNLSARTFKTSIGEEIGIGQALQATAAGIEPKSEMNPILLKFINGRIQLILNGRPYDKERPAHDILMNNVMSSFEELEDQYDIVVCEGSGSPVELNLMEDDVANLNLVKNGRIPSIIVGDIERGGVFAAIYGTWKLTPADQRRYLKGFIINRFKGEPSILEKGVQLIRDLTGMECIGIIPYIDLRLPEEDLIKSENTAPYDNTMKDAYISCLDRFIEESSQSMDYERLIQISSEIIL